MISYLACALIVLVGALTLSSLCCWNYGPARASAEPNPSDSAPEQVEVFISGEEGYHTFRIPALYVTPEGTLLAFCEGRRNSRSDSGDIDLVLKELPEIVGKLREISALDIDEED